MLVGVEQAAGSTPLQAFTFPPRTVLVLGSERQGIPPDVLSLLDATVEIPQLGVIRSLNAHVAGALCLYQSCVQRLAAAAAARPAAGG